MEGCVSVLLVVAFVFGVLVGYGGASADADARVCTFLAAERGDTLAIATEVPQCRDHLMRIYMDARTPDPTP